MTKRAGRQLVLSLAWLACMATPGEALASFHTGPDPVVAAAGDISCAQLADGATTCRDQATSDLLVGQGLARVLTLGDNQYETGQLTAFNTYYEPTWGRVKDITSPAPGNHDPFTSGYSAYFGPRAPAAYYSYDIGAWHLISLDSNNVNAAEVAWLDDDLDTNAGGKCVLAYWHHPRFSSGSTHGTSTRAAPFWSELYEAKADVVLSSHEHFYERFAPQTPAAVSDPTGGIRQFIVGTGGKSHYGFAAPQPNSEVRLTGTYGVLKLTLRDGAYDWEFVPEAGQTATDSGTGICHSAVDLSLTNTGSPDPVQTGQTLTYTVTARNDGPMTVTGVALTDLLARGVVLRSARSDRGRCVLGRPRKIDCRVAQLASGESLTATIVVRPARHGTIVNTATVRASLSLDLTPSNDTAIATTQVTR